MYLLGIQQKRGLSIYIYTLSTLYCKMTSLQTNCPMTPSNPFLSYISSRFLNLKLDHEIISITIEDGFPPPIHITKWGFPATNQRFFSLKYIFLLLKNN